MFKSRTSLFVLLETDIAAILFSQEEIVAFFEGKRCPEGWMRFGCSCYYKSTEKKTWINSRDFCQKNGSDLVVVNSKEEQVGVFTLVPSSFFVKGNQDGENVLRKNIFFCF
uniref:C-type lectin domain-containing protein n=1 Tax=Oryzias latipes TaxID=8090 RepID=A0A3P9M7S5_ORYLA